VETIAYDKTQWLFTTHKTRPEGAEFFIKLPNDNNRCFKQLYCGLISWKCAMKDKKYAHESSRNSFSRHTIPLLFQWLFLHVKSAENRGIFITYKHKIHVAVWKSFSRRKNCQKYIISRLLLHFVYICHLPMFQLSSSQVH
jgi:hypothetical protein